MKGGAMALATDKIDQAIGAINASALADPEKEKMRSVLHDIGSTYERQLSTALQNDKWVYRWVVIFLGLAVLVTIVGSVIPVVLSPARGTFPQLPDGLVAISSAAVGALAGLLAPSPGQRQG
jgi:uncharacterized integral membrane protein